MKSQNNIFIDRGKIKAIHSTMQYGKRTIFTKRHQIFIPIGILFIDKQNQVLKRNTLILFVMFHACTHTLWIILDKYLKKPQDFILSPAKRKEKKFCSLNPFLYFDSIETEWDIFKRLFVRIMFCCYLDDGCCIHFRMRFKAKILKKKRFDGRWFSDNEDWKDVTICVPFWVQEVQAIIRRNCCMRNGLIYIDCRYVLDRYFFYTAIHNLQGVLYHVNS